MDPTDAPEPGSPLWWLLRLDKKLAERCKRYEVLDRYYRGDHPLPEGDERARELFRKFQRKARTNYMRFVANAVTDRLSIIGFRAGADADTSDADAWRIWQANHLDADSSMVHDAAAKFSDAYVIIGPADDDDDDLEDGPSPVITGEDPREVIVDTDPVNRRVVRSAAKIWTDDYDGKRHAIVYLPEAFHYFVEDAPQSDHGESEPAAWMPELVNDEGVDSDDLDGDQGDLPTNTIVNPIAPTVPVVRFVTDPDLKGEGIGEFEDVIDIQDRINDTILNRLVIAKMQAYRQRWAKGIQTEDEDGNELPFPFVPGVDLLWAVEDPDAQFGDFAQSDLGPLIDAVKSDVQAIVNLTGLPPDYVSGDLVNASADAFAAAEWRLISKVRDRQRQYGESWELVLRIAFLYLGEPDRIKVDAEVQWMNPVRTSEAQLADAAVKKQAAGVPWRQRMRDLGYTDSEIERMDAERKEDAKLAPPAPIPPTQKIPAGADVGPAPDVPAPEKPAPIPVA